MQENKSLEEKVQFYKFRKACRCEALNPLWEQIQFTPKNNSFSVLQSF